jgi:hypothetical protein
VQAAAVTLPGRPLTLPARIRGRAWALLLPGVLVAFVIALGIDASLATRLAELAIVTPVFALLAPAVVERRWRLPVGLVAVLAVACGLWQRQGAVGGLARAIAIACACAVLATLLAGVAPASALRSGLIALVVLDVILVASGSVGTTSNELHHAVAPAGLPSFQDATLGPATMGYGDLFGAAVLGSVLAREGRRRWRAAAAVLASAWTFGLLLTVVTTLPATVPLLAGLAVARQESRSM